MMIETIRIQNYKSIEDITFKPGRLSLFIGQNGGGKSNLLEAIALGFAAASGRLSNEFMSTRGVRWTNPKLMRSAFSELTQDQPITITLDDDELALTNDNKAYSKWVVHPESIRVELGALLRNLAKSWGEEEFERAELATLFGSIAKTNDSWGKEEFKSWGKEKLKEVLEKQIVVRSLGRDVKASDLGDFVIFSPEYSVLKNVATESQLEPLSANGAGLFKQLLVLQSDLPERFGEIKEHLRLLGWFEDFHLNAGGLEEPSLQIVDRFLSKLADYTQKNVNEGFLYLLFHLTLMVSPQAPKVFGIDNLETAFNPKLCTKLIEILVALAKKYDKQFFVTTHNPAILDGIDLKDPEQKIFVVSRSPEGATKLRELTKPKLLPGQTPVKLSTAFLDGMLGGLPKEF